MRMDVKNELMNINTLHKILYKDSKDEKKRRRIWNGNKYDCADYANECENK